MIVRDQKTSQIMGNIKCPIPERMQDLFDHWVTVMRPKVMKADHNSVFFSITTGKPFDQQAFSKFIAKAFLKVTGHSINLQKIRRIVAEGNITPLNRTRNTCFLPFIAYLKEHQAPEEWQWLAHAMQTGVPSLKKTYFHDGLQKQSYEKVRRFLMMS